MLNKTSTNVVNEIDMSIPHDDSNYAIAYITYGRLNEILKSNTYENYNNEELAVASKIVGLTKRKKESIITALIKQNEKMISKTAYHYVSAAPSSFDIDDLRQIARCAFFERIKDYDVNKTKFSTYICNIMQDKLKNEIGNEIGKSEKAYYNNMMKKVTEAKNALIASGVTNPQASDIYTYLNSNSPTKRIAMSTICHTLSALGISQPVSYDAAVLENFLSSKYGDIEDKAANSELRDVIMNVLNNLSETDRYIFMMRTGYPDGRAHTNDEIAKIMVKSKHFDPEITTPFKVNKRYLEIKSKLALNPTINQYNDNEDDNNIINDGEIVFMDIDSILRQQNMLFDKIAITSIPDFPASAE